MIFPGTHTYNFSCTLPHLLPTSFEGKKGHIRYTVRVALERPWKFDHTYRVAFTVLKPIDLNLESPVLRLPSQGEITKTFCCGPCKSPPMLIRVGLPQSGYVPGQTITTLVEVSNLSRIKVEMVKFILRQIIHYHSSSPRTKTLEEIIDICQQRVITADDKELNQLKQDMVIPAVPPTISNLSRVINIHYEVKVEINVRGTHINPVLCIPITIGTYPLISYQQFQSDAHRDNVEVSTEVGIHAGSIPVQPINRPLSNISRQSENLRKFGHTPKESYNNVHYNFSAAHIRGGHGEY